MIFIRNVLPGDYLVRTLSPTTWAVIRENYENSRKQRSESNF